MYTYIRSKRTAKLKPITLITSRKLRIQNVKPKIDITDAVRFRLVSFAVRRFQHYCVINYET